MLVLLSSCSHKNYLASKWEKSIYKEVEEIPSPDYECDKDKKLYYLITNDSANMYIHIKAVDKTVQKHILAPGLTVWIDTLAKNKKLLGIKFPIDNYARLTMPPKRERTGQNEEQNFDEMKDQLSQKYFDIELIGFTGKGSREIIPGKNEQISVKIDLNKQKDILYTYKVPFKSIGLRYQSEKLLSINLESEALSSANRPGGMEGGRPERMGGGGPGGMGGSMGGGGRPGGMQEGRSSQMQDKQQMTTSIKIQLKKVKLL